MSASQTPFDFHRLVALAAEGKSQRWIARRLGLKPTYVRQRLNELLRQASEEFASKHEENALSNPDLPAHVLPNDDRPPGFDPTNIRRCRGCGALVYLWPCLSCHVEGNVSAESTHK